MANKQKHTPALAGKQEESSAKNRKGQHSAGLVTRLIQYFQAAQVELQKVSWPTWKEVKVTGYAVAALVVIMSLFLGMADALLGWLVRSFLSMGS